MNLGFVLGSKGEDVLVVPWRTIDGSREEGRTGTITFLPLGLPSTLSSQGQARLLISLSDPYDSRKKKSFKKKYFTVITLVAEEQLLHLCPAQESRFVEIFSKNSAELWRTAKMKAESSHLLAFVVVHILNQKSPVDVPALVSKGTEMHFWFIHWCACG